MENGYESIVHTDEPTVLKLGDWAERIGNDYTSGGLCGPVNVWF